jgi:hypothetical protein
MISRRKALALLPAIALTSTLEAQSQMQQSVKAPPLPAPPAPVQRQHVLPLDFIQRYKLRPTTTSQYGPFLLGMDGLAYDFDDVMAAVFEMTRDHWQLPRK